MQMIDDMGAKCYEGEVRKLRKPVRATQTGRSGPREGSSEEEPRNQDKPGQEAFTESLRGALGM